MHGVPLGSKMALRGNLDSAHVIQGYLWVTGRLITGRHGSRVYSIGPLILFGLASGWYLHVRRKPRVILPLIHGSANLVLIILVLFQAISGWQVYNAYVLGH